jgi:polar amino acid transport system substrate-binding protein
MTLTLSLFAILATACSSGGSSPSAAAPTTAPAASTAVATTAPSVAPSATPDACAVATLPLLTAGKLTIGTDNPAFPP